MYRELAYMRVFIHLKLNENRSRRAKSANIRDNLAVTPTAASR